MDHAPVESRTIGDYLDRLGSADPTPGGGSATALLLSLAAGLGQMVVSLTKEPSDALADEGERLAQLGASALAFADADELAYAGYIEASSLPKSTDKEKSIRRATMQAALQEAAAVPAQLAQCAIDILGALPRVIEDGNPRVRSDAHIAALFARCCVDASVVNIRVNVPFIADKETARGLADHADELETLAEERLDACLALFVEGATG